MAEPKAEPKKTKLSISRILRGMFLGEYSDRYYDIKN